MCEEDVFLGQFEVMFIKQADDRSLVMPNNMVDVGCGIVLPYITISAYFMHHLCEVVDVIVINTD